MRFARKLGQWAAGTMRQYHVTPALLEEVDITGLHKGEVLAALFNKAKPGGGLAALHYRASDTMSPVEGERILKDTSGDVEYLGGRALKLSLRKNENSVETEWYDRNNGGEGAGRKAIEALRESKRTTAISPTTAVTDAKRAEEPFQTLYDGEKVPVAVMETTFAALKRLEGDDVSPSKIALYDAFQLAKNPAADISRSRALLQERELVDTEGKMAQDVAKVVKNSIYYREQFFEAIGKRVPMLTVVSPVASKQQGLGRSCGL